jgi:hypothetical protein
MQMTRNQLIADALAAVRHGYAQLARAAELEEDAGYRADIADARADVNMAVASIEQLLPAEVKRG